MKNRWQRIETWLAKEYPEMLSELNDGCNQEQLAEIEKEIGLKLPESVKDFYLVHNGQENRDYRGLFYDIALLPLEEIVREWQMWSEIIDSYDEEVMKEEFDDFIESLNPDKVKAQYANKKWIPFAAISGSNYLGLDFDPEVNGRIGQVINFGREEEEKAVLADSFEAFIDWYINELESGNYSFLNQDSYKYFIPKELQGRFSKGKSGFLGYVANRFVK